MPISRRSVVSPWRDVVMPAELALGCCSSCAVDRTRVADPVDCAPGLTIDEPTASLRRRQQPGPNA